MSEPFIGEIRMFGGNFAIRSWAFCNGQTMQISQNDALFSLLGTTYGGDGRTTFDLPDMRGRIPLHEGSGSGLTPRSMGEQGGTQTVTLTTNELPSHNHMLEANDQAGDSNDPTGRHYAKFDAVTVYHNSANTTLNAGVVGYQGGTQPHNNLMPAQCVSFLIALQGIFPSRT